MEEINRLMDPRVVAESEGKIDFPGQSQFYREAESAEPAPFFYKHKHFNPEEHVQIRILSAL